MPPNRPSPKHEFLALDDAASYAGVHPRTIRRHVSSGRIRGYRCGPRLIRIDRFELDAMITSIPTAAAA
ncbi:helix-turn-helix domain-containing protein [Jatrophihabitans sp. DSM 45814]